MKEILESRVGKDIEVSFGAGAVSGKVLKIEDGILYMEKDDQNYFIVLDKVVAVWDSKEKSEKRSKSPGFMLPKPE